MSMKTKRVPQYVPTTFKDSIKQKALRYAMIFVNLIGAFPNMGFLEKDSSKIRCRWIPPYTLLCVLSTLGLSITIVSPVYEYILSNQYGFTAISNVLFNVFLLALTLNIQYLSVNWIKNMRMIESIELSLPVSNIDDRAIMECNKCLFGVMFFAVFEHLSYINFSYNQMYSCHRLPEDSGLYIKSYFIYDSKRYFQLFEFNYFAGAILQFLITQGTILLSWNDVFIMLCSIYLTARIKSFNRIISHKVHTVLFQQESWEEVRRHFTKLNELVAIVNNYLNPLLLISYTTNTYYLCEKLFYAINNDFRNVELDTNSCKSMHRKDWQKEWFLVSSFAFMALRAFLVSIFASQVYATSKMSLIDFYKLPTNLFNMEIQRLQDQITNSKLGLNCYGFFFITRSMVLRIAASIITYELVLVQWHMTGRT